MSLRLPPGQFSGIQSLRSSSCAFAAPLLITLICPTFPMVVVVDVAAEVVTAAADVEVSVVAVEVEGAIVTVAVGTLVSVAVER